MFFGDFNSVDDVAKAFGGFSQWDEEPAKEYLEILETLNSAKVILAAYDIDGYEGSAYVVYEKDGMLYTVSGSHCSCYGLENQWSPCESALEIIQANIETNYLWNDLSEAKVYMQNLHQREHAT